MVCLAQLGAVTKRQLEREQRQHQQKRSNGYNKWFEEQGRLGFGLLHSLTREQADETIEAVLGRDGALSLDLQSRVDGEFGS